MKSSSVLSALCALALLAPACDKGTQKAAEAAPAQGAKEAAPSPDPKPEAGADAKAPQANPHVLPPSPGPKAVELGPPQEITPSGTVRSETVDGLVMSVPEEWVRGEVSGQMRKGSFVLPGPGGGAQLLVYRFPGGAGTPEQNIERWKGQITGGEAKTSELEAGGLKISAVDVSGRFGGSAMPGVPPTPAIEEARLLAAAISGSGDPWYLKVVGPAKTLEVWTPAWDKLLAELNGGS